MHELAPFKFESNTIRVLDIEGEPWFIVSDICKAIEHTQPSRVVQGLDEDEVQVIDSRGVNSFQPNLGDSSLLVVSESGLYSVLVRSHKPKAKPFRRWVTHEVLPSIRKTGSYTLPGVDQQRRLEHLEASLARSKVKADALDRLAAAEGSVCIADAAKILGVPQTDMFDILSKLHWIFKRSAHGKWLPYADKEQRGFLIVCIDPVYDAETAEKKEYPQTRVTLKGLSRLAIVFAAYYKRQAEAEQRQIAGISAEEPKV